MSFPKYPAYKDSGVEWLGRVPEHWRVDRLKRNLSLLTEKSDSKHNPVALENIEGWSGRFIPSETEFEGDGVKFDTGDILFGKLRPYLAKVLLAPWPGEAVGDFHVLRAKPSVFSRFAQYLMLTRSFIDIVDGSTFGSKMPRAGWDFVGDMPLPIPSFDEQKSIADFLDRETAKIDALVAEQEQLITLLKEKRQAVISHAVTKGLDASVPMKDSGVEWLGAVPAHWWATTLRRCTRSVETGGTPSLTPSTEEIEDGVNWFTPGDFNEGLSLEKSARQIPAAAVESGYAKVFPAGAILIVSIGATLGKVGLIMQDASANQQVNAVIPAAGVNSLFLAFSLSVRVDAMKFLSNASTIGIMNQEKTKDIPVAIPPEPEQVDIADHLAKSCVQFDALIKEATSTMMLLQERRSALISAAVTGQIDVR